MTEAGDQTDELYNILNQPVKRLELIVLGSLLVRLCTYQQMMLRSLRTPENDDFDREVAESDKLLDETVAALVKLGAVASDGN